MHLPRRTGRRGGAAVEFALIAPVLFAMLSGIVEWGWYLFNLQLVLNAVADGTRAGARIPMSASPSPATVAHDRAAALLQSLGVVSSASTASAAVTVITSTGATPEVFVSVSLPYTPLIGLIPTPATYSAQSTMRLEDPN
ncbi:MAG: TadE family protein [Myxococcota bacterium]